MRPDLRALLCAVLAGAWGVYEVAAATGLVPCAVQDRAAELVRSGHLCALDGEPWAVTYPDGYRLARWSR